MSWIGSLATVLTTGCIYSILAVGIVLIYRTSRVLAFHLGEIGMLVAYVLVSIWSPGSGAASLGLALGCAILTAIAAGLIMYYLVERLGGGYGHFVGTVITIAATIALKGLMSLLWGGQTWRLPLFDGEVMVWGTPVPASSAAVLVIGVVVLFAIVLIMRSSTIGIDMKAIACNPQLARLRGIPIQMTLCVVWLVGSILAAISGVLIASVSVVSIEGSVIGVSAIVAALIGGMTSVGFALVGAFLLAACETLVTLFGEPRFSQVIPVLGLLLLLAFRPTGLASQSESINRV